jgi:hypothetical protein|tara:strand:+ start:164 stop:304 length:141 start_codon:yes stop_codon:yes gene_type:complete
MKENNDGNKGKFQAPGTLVLVFIFLVFFVVLYCANWIMLSGTWGVR